MKKATHAVQQWGISLAVRISAAIARPARATLGQPTDVSLQDSGVFVTRASASTLSLMQRLEAFDPAMHGGEAMATGRAGVEVS